MKINKKRSFLVLLLVLSFVIPAAFAKEMTNIEVKKGKIYLNLKDAEIKTVLQIFAKATGLNIVTSDDVTGKVTVTFTSIDPKKGLEAVLRTKGLDWFEEDGTIYVSSKKILRSYYLNNARPSDLQVTISAILPSGSVVSADDTYNALVVQTTSDYLPRIEKLIGELDVSPTQIMAEVKMISINNGDDGTLGLNLTYKKASGAYAKTVGFALSSEVQGLYANALSIFSNASLEAFLTALASNVKYDIIATPRLTTINNKQASLLIGQKLGYKTLVVNQTSTTQQINFLNVGTSLILTPNVTKSGLIRMKVEPKISDGSITNDIPSEDTTETHNEVIVKDGQTFVIGGLVKDKDTQTDYGIPFLMDIPFLGGLFRRTVTNKTKVELVVFVTPHILTEKFQEKLDETYKDLKQKADVRDARLIH